MIYQTKPTYHVQEGNVYDSDVEHHKVIDRSKTSLRMNYEAQVAVIKKQIGDLEAIRVDLGLTQRKMAQLLLVDPSTWTRWVKGGDNVPPHIWRALHWYLTLKEKVPGLTPQFFLTNLQESSHQDTRKALELERSERKESILAMKEDLTTLLTEKKALHFEIIELKKDLLFFKKLSILSFFIFGIGIIAGLFWKAL